MMRVHVVAAGAALLVASVAFGQGNKPGQAGPPTATAQVIVDATGVTVGEVLEHHNNGFSTVAVKYAMPQGDSVVLRAGSQGLSSFIRVNPAPPNAQPQQVRLFFQSTDCSGDAFFNVIGGTGGTPQLTRRQVMTVRMVPPNPASPPTGTSCPTDPGSTLLYAATSEDYTCPINAGFGAPQITFHSYFADNFENGSTCISAPAGITFGGEPTSTNFLFGMFVRFKLVENLTARYQAPFFIQ